MMRPAASLLLALAGWTALGVAVALGGLPLSAWLAFAAATGLLAAIDAARLVRRGCPQVQRDVAAVVPMGPETVVTLHLRGTPRGRMRMRVHDLHPGGWSVQGIPRRLDLSAGTEATLRYRATPDARGQCRFDGCQLRLWSPWRFWHRQCVAGAPSTVRVYPNFAPLAQMAGLSVELASQRVGARLQRRRGEGTEFQELRDYRVGDSLRRIDWKATARCGRLISREYRDERSQQIVLMLDCGRRMLARDERGAHFDRVLDASLALAYIALRQGDAVGLLACAGETRRWLAPYSGAGGMDRLLGAGYDLKAEPVVTDFLAAASALQQSQQRRALVILVTNVRDEDDAELRTAVAMLSRRHLVLVASLREDALDASLAAADGELEDAILAASTLDYLSRRERVHAALREQGVATLDVTCRELSGALVERYLKIKRDGRL